MHTTVFRVGEGDRNARHKEHFLKGTSKIASGDTHMVLGNYLSIFWTH